MLGSFVKGLFIVVHLLVVVVSGKVLVDHETGVMERNCSALLNIPLFHDVTYSGKYNTSECPPWFKGDNQTGVCRAGPTLNGIIEQDMSTLQTSIMQCYCMTEEDGVVTVGPCLHKCLSITPYYPLPCQLSQLQNFTCPPSMHRSGPLCSKCINGHAYPVYSYKLKCFSCEDSKYNWLKYFAAAYLPLTLFYIVVAMFSISFTSPLIIGVVMVFQLTASPTLLKLLNGISTGTKYDVLVNLCATFASFLNLDFGRMYYTFCLHPNATALEIRALDNGIVVFPVVLIFVTNFLVKLHGKRFQPLIWVWLAIGIILKPL